jgi:hypothetical protein
MGNLRVPQTFKTPTPMAEPIILDANITPLKKQLKDATQELQIARQRFGDLSAEAVEAAKKVAGIRDSIAAANEQAALFDPGKRFQALTSAASLAAGAVGAVQGAMGLFGAESEDVQKALLKVQSAMALSQGLSQLADLSKVTEELQSSFKGLIGTTAQKTAATTADTAGVVANTAANKSQSIATLATSAATKAATISLRVMRGALISLGIPALVLGLVSLVQNFGAIKAAVLNALPGLKAFSDTIGGLVQGVTDFFGITSKANRELDVLTKGTAARNESIEMQIKLLSAQGGKEKEIFELKRKQGEQELADIFKADRLEKKTDEEREKRKKEILNNITLDTAAFNKKQADDEKAAAEKQAAEAKTRAEKAKAEQEKVNAEKLEAEKKLQEEQKALQEEKAAQDTEFQKRLNDVLTETRLAGIKEENDRARAELLARQEQELADLAVDTKLRADQKLALQKQLEVRNKQELDALEMTFAEEAAMRDLEELDAEMRQADASFAIQRNLLDQKDALLREQLAMNILTEKEFTEAVRANSEARIKIDQAEVNAKLQNASQIAGLLSGLSNLIGKETQAGKGFAVASATIDTYLSAQKAYQSMVGIPIAGPALAAVAAGVAIAGGIKNVREITRTKIPGIGGGVSAPNISASAPAVTSAVPTIGTSPVTALGTMMQNQPPLRAYVVESEVTGTQKRVADIERRAGF